TRPEGNLSWTACQRNRPVASSKHMTTPLSRGTLLSGSFGSASVSRGLRGRSLLVPTNTLPLATTGPPEAFDPSAADHLIFLPVLPPRAAGPRRAEGWPMWRPGGPPRTGRSEADSSTAPPASRGTSGIAEQPDDPPAHRARPRAAAVAAPSGALRR